MKRRQALLLLGGSGALLAVPAICYERATEESAVVAVVHKHLGYLRLDPDGVRRFAADYAAAQITSTTKLRALGATGPVYSLLPQPLLPRGIRRGEDRIITKFLLSSDLFGGGDPQRMIHYLGFFDPVRACSNPFARPVQSSESHKHTATGTEAA